eukprot:10758120-Lingulodinium_polyedra.AAC.2
MVLMMLTTHSCSACAARGASENCELAFSTCKRWRARSGSMASFSVGSLLESTSAYFSSAALPLSCRSSANSTWHVESLSASLVACQVQAAEDLGTPRTCSWGLGDSQNLFMGTWGLPELGVLGTWGLPELVHSRSWPACR